RNVRTLKKRRAEKAKGSRYDGGHDANKQHSEDLRRRDSAKEKDQAEKRDRGDDQQEYVRQSRNQLAGEQRKRREFRAKQQVIGLPLLLSIDGGCCEGGGNKDHPGQLHQ